MRGGAPAFWSHQGPTKVAEGGSCPGPQMPATSPQLPESIEFHLQGAGPVFCFLSVLPLTLTLRVSEGEGTRGICLPEGNDRPESNAEAGEKPLSEQVWHPVRPFFHNLLASGFFHQS